MENFYFTRDKRNMYENGKNTECVELATNVLRVLYLIKIAFTLALSQFNVFIHTKCSKLHQMARRDDSL